MTCRQQVQKSFTEEVSDPAQFENFHNSVTPQPAETKPNYQTEVFNDSKPEIENIPVYDPSFATSFSDTSTYEPPIRPQEFAAEHTPSPENHNYSQTPTQQTHEQNQTIEKTFTVPQSQPPEFFKANNNPQAGKRMNALFYKMSEAGASDLHLSVSMPPLIRKDGKMMTLESGESSLTPDAMKELLTSMMPAKNQEEFHQRHDTDFACEIESLARFRANIFMDRKGMGGVYRIIPTKILTAEQLGLSKAIMDLCNLLIRFSRYGSDRFRKINDALRDG